jgi:ubiquinone/menaquinone biosynthesis C-methylase UbiE
MEVEPSNTASLTTGDRDHIEQAYEKMFDLDHILNRIGKNDRILDLGRGKKGSFFARKIKEKFPLVEIIGLEYSYKENLLGNDDAKSTTSSLVAGNAIELPFANSSFDMVISGEVTQDNPFFSDDLNIEKLREEANRVLNHKGTFVIFHEKEKVVPPTYKPIHEQVGYTKVDQVPLALSGLVYGVYGKENTNFGDNNSLFRVLKDISPKNDTFFIVGRYFIHGIMLFCEGIGESKFEESKIALKEKIPEAHLNILDELSSSSYSETLSLLDQYLNMSDNNFIDDLFEKTSEEWKFVKKNWPTVCHLNQRFPSAILTVLNNPEQTLFHQIGLEIISNDFL